MNVVQQDQIKVATCSGHMLHKVPKGRTIVQS